MDVEESSDVLNIAWQTGHSVIMSLLCPGLCCTIGVDLLEGKKSMAQLL